MPDNMQPTDYDEIGIMGIGPVFDKLSDYFDEENKRINFSCLNKLQSDLDLDIDEWSVHENLHSKQLSGECGISLLAKYRKRISSIFEHSY